MGMERRILPVLAALFLIPACSGGGGSSGGGTPATTAATTEPISPQEAGLGGSQAPFIRLVSPTPGSTCNEGATLTLQAVAVDPDTLIVRVDFFDGSKPIGSKSAPPFLVAWGGLKPGSHVITAVAYDVQGLSATSEPVTVFVLARHDDGQDQDRDRGRDRNR